MRCLLFCCTLGDFFDSALRVMSDFIASCSAGWHCALYKFTHIICLLLYRQNIPCSILLSPLAYKNHCQVSCVADVDITSYLAVCILLFVLLCHKCCHSSVFYLLQVIYSTLPSASKDSDETSMIIDHHKVNLRKCVIDVCTVCLPLFISGCFAGQLVTGIFLIFVSSSWEVHSAGHIVSNYRFVDVWFTRFVSSFFLIFRFVLQSITFTYVTLFRFVVSIVCLL